MQASTNIFADDLDHKIVTGLLGRKSGYYINVFNKIKKCRNYNKNVLHIILAKYASVNWAAFWVSLIMPFPFFLYFRKLYKMAVVCNFFSLVISSLSLTNAVPNAGYVYHGMYILFSLLYFNVSYYNCINKKKHKVRLLPEIKRMQVVNKLGGVSYFVPLVMFLLSLPCLFLMIVIVSYCKLHL